MPEPSASILIGLPLLDPDQEDLDPVSSSPPADRISAPGDVLMAVLVAKPGSQCSTIDGEEEEVLAPPSPPAATHGNIHSDVQLLASCCDVEDGNNIDAQAPLSPLATMLGPVRGEDVVLMPGTPRAIDEGHAFGAAVKGVPVPLTSSTAVDCESSTSCYPVPPGVGSELAPPRQP